MHNKQGANCIFSAGQNLEIQTGNEKTKLRIFDWNVKLVLFYECESWKMTAEIVNKVKIFVKMCKEVIRNGMKLGEKNQTVEN